MTRRSSTLALTVLIGIGWLSARAESPIGAPDLSSVLDNAVNTVANNGGTIDTVGSGQVLQQDQLVRVVASNAIESRVTGNQATIGVADSGARAGNALEGAFANYQGVLNVVQNTGSANSITQAVSLQSGLDIRATAP